MNDRYRQSTPEVQQAVWDHAARLAHERLQSYDSASSHLMIVDDSREKQDSYLNNIGDIVHSKAGVNFGFSVHSTGDDAIGFLEAFREAESEFGKAHLVVLMDGELAKENDNVTTYKKGVDVARAINDKCISKGWTVPFFVGISSNPDNNADLANVVPKRILPGVHLRRLSTIVKAIVASRP